jgi:hypothetical protein
VPLTLLYDCLFSGLSWGWVLLLGLLAAEECVVRVLRFPGLLRIIYILGGVFAGAVALVAVGLLVEGMRTSLREVWFLRRGKLALAHVTGHEPCDRTRGYRVTFEFTDGGNEIRQAQISTHNWTVLEPSCRTPILYDPGRPDRALMVQDMKCAPRFNGRGGFRAPEAGTLALILTPPVLLGLLLMGCLVEWLGKLLRAAPH